MFKLRVSKTLLSLSIDFLLSGPGICVCMIGAVGSSGKNDCSLLVSGITAAAAEAYCLRSAIGAILGAFDAYKHLNAGRVRPAVRRTDAIVSMERESCKVMERCEELGEAQMRGVVTALSSEIALLLVGRKTELKVPQEEVRQTAARLLILHNYEG
jgi:hypothetical protein